MTVEDVRQLIRENGYMTAMQIVIETKGEFHLSDLDQLPCEDIHLVEYTNTHVEHIPRIKDLYYYNPFKSEE